MDSVKKESGGGEKEAVAGEQPPQATAQHTKTKGEEKIKKNKDSTTTANGEEKNKGTAPTANGDEEEVDAGGQGSTMGLGQTNLARMSVAGEAFRYCGSHKRRGHCVIFNHRYFDSKTGLGERNGTDRDRDQTQQLFRQMEFDVKVHDNLTVGEIKDALEDLAFGTDHSDCDMLVMIFMSHGEQDVMWGRDGHFKPDALFEGFQADQCKSLAGKPKIFFIQACRGEGLDTGVTLVRNHPSDEIDSGRLAYKVPTTADFLICWSTVPGHYSWRNTTNGSWFIQSLVHVLSKEAAHEDLLSMMTSTNRHMVLNFESNTPCKQLPLSLYFATSCLSVKGKNKQISGALNLPCQVLQDGDWPLLCTGSGTGLILASKRSLREDDANNVQVLGRSVRAVLMGYEAGFGSVLNSLRVPRARYALGATALTPHGGYEGQTVYFPLFTTGSPLPMMITFTLQGL
ncbi:Caspase-1 [Chionoecetes opilio]|uniref:Caspase-1 n=1 Tax=Chionoecetes opilio TaxID=41210 RepID=A0A8J5CR63_CHIOP|nr:Caspase-1 [Chionoecetes opilio]